MINKVVLVGRLTRDPELRKTPNGASVVQYTIACDRRIKTPGQPDADFINCVAWNKTADIMSQYLHKGSLIGVEGRIQTRSYDNQQGQRVYVTEVVTENFSFLESKNAQSQGGYASQGGYNQGYGQQSGYQQPSYSQPSYSQPSYSQPQMGGSAFGSDYETNDTLDIASDDLPF